MAPLVVWLTSWLVALVSASTATRAAVEPRWRLAAEGHSQPAADEATVYFLTKHHDVVAVDAADGRERWRRNTAEPGDETLGSAVVRAGSLVVAGDYALIALDAVAGSRRWRFEPRDGYGPGLYLGDASGGLVFAGSPAGRLYAVRQEDGRMAWSRLPVSVPKTTVYQPVADGERVAAGYTTFGAVPTGGLLVVDRQTGRVLWRRDFPAQQGGATTGFGGGPVFAGDLVFAASGDGSIYRFDLSTGATLGMMPAVSRADGRTQERDWRALALSGHTLIAGSVSGIITGIDVSTGREVWRYAHPEGGSVGTRITADDRTVYVPHLGGLLVAISARNGHERWQIGGWGDGFSWAPMVAGKTVFAVASRSGLAAIPR